MKKQLILLCLGIIHINAMNNKEEQIGQEIQCKKPIPCKEIKNNSYVLVKRESGKLILGYVTAIYGNTYYVKDTPKSGQSYNISDLYCEESNSSR